MDNLSELTVFVAEWGPYVAKGAATGLGMQMVTGIVKAGKFVRSKRAEEQFDGLYAALGAGIAGSVWRSVADDPSEESRAESWAVYESEQWWGQFTDRVLEPLSDSKAWELYVQLFVTGATDSLQPVRDRLESEVGSLQALGKELSIDLEDFLFWLGPCLREELQIQAIKGAASFGELVQSLTPVSGTSDQGGSPASIRRRTRAYLEWVLRFCEARMHSPLTGATPNPSDLHQAVKVHVAVRQYVETGRGVYEPLSTRSSGNGKPKVVPWDEMAARDGHVAVLADPGVGKTLLIHREASRIAVEAMAALENHVRPEDLHLPVLARCDVLHEVIKNDGQVSLETACAGLQHFDDESFRVWFTRHLQTTPNTYLLDALDEVPVESGSSPLGQLFQSWQLRHGKGRVIFTSRLTGYRRPSGLPTIDEVELQPFTPDEVFAYVDAWALQPDSKRRLVKRLKSDDFMGLLRTPLLLSFACALAGEDQDLPDSRAGLYDRILNFLLDDYHRKGERHAATKIQTLSLRGRADLLRILGDVAVHFADHPDGWTDRMPVDEVLEVIGDAKVHDELDPLRAAAQTGILVPGGIDRLGTASPYYFMHRTIAEYLVAKTLAVRKETNWQEFLETHLWFERDWDEVLTLIGEFPSVQRSYLDALLAMEPDLLYRALGLATRVAARASISQELVSAVGKRWMSLWQLGHPAAPEQLASLAPKLPPGLMTKIIGTLRSGDPRSQKAALSILAESGMEAAAEAIIDVLVDANASWDLRSSAAYATSALRGKWATEKKLAILSDPAVHHWARGMIADTFKRGEDEAAAQGLIEVLGDPHTDSLARGMAALALGERAGDAGIQALIQILRDPALDQEERGEAARALRDRGGERVERALRELFAEPDADSWARWMAALMLAGCGGDNVNLNVIKILRDPVTPLWVSWSAAQSLQDSKGGEDIDQALIELLHDPGISSWTRWAAAFALGKRGGKEGETALIAFLGDPEAPSWAKDETVPELRDCGGKEGARALIELMCAPGTDDNARSNAALALRALDDEETYHALVSLLQDREIGTTTLELVFTALRGRATEEVKRVLIEILSNPKTTSSDRIWAIRRLGGHRGKEADQVLIEILSNAGTDQDVRTEAAMTLSSRGLKEADGVLFEILHSPDASSRKRIRAVQLLGARGGNEGDDVLIEILSRPAGEHTVRAEAAKVLGGREGRNVALALGQCLGDPDISQAAGEALSLCSPLDVIQALRTSISSVKEAATRQMQGGQLSFRTMHDLTPVAWASNKWTLSQRNELLDLLGEVTQIVGQNQGFSTLD